MISKFFCYFGMHYFKIINIDYTFSYIENIETVECKYCKLKKVRRKKIIYH